MKKFFHITMMLAVLALLLATPGAAHATGPVTITVNTTAGTVSNDGNCSFPEAVQAVNTELAVDNCPAGTGAGDTIAFGISGTGIQTITLSSTTSFTQPVIIDGTTQGGTTPLIRLDGNNNSGISGLEFDAGSGGSTVKGLMITQFPFAGIKILTGGSSSFVTVTGNYIGTDGSNALGGTYGVYIYGGQYAQIGGASSSLRNVISGNTDNVYILGDGVTAADHNTIQGNYIGLNAAGTGAITSTDGIYLTATSTTGASYNLITGNVISGHSATGIRIYTQYNNNNTISSNLIGTDYTGASAVGNYDGVYVSDATGTIIGGNGDITKYNVISGNIHSGITVDGASSNMVIDQNILGTNDSGTASLGNTQIGIYIYTDYAVTVSNNWITNSLIGMNLGGSLTIPSGAGNCFAGNTTGVSDQSTTNPLLSNSYWGASTGPYNATLNPLGNGDKYTGSGLTWQNFYLNQIPAPGSGPTWASSVQPICGPYVGRSSASLNFGNQLLNLATSQTLTITNTGIFTLNITGISTVAPFSLGTSTCTNTTHLTHGQTCQITVNFKPTSAVTYNQNLTIVSNANSSGDQIPLTGVGVVGTQLLKNGSFELDANKDKRPDSWSYTNFNATTDGRDCSTRKVGTCSLKFVGNGTIKTAMQTYTFLTPGVAGDDLTFSLWSRSTYVPSTATYTVTIYVYNGTTLVKSQALTFTKGTHGWINRFGGFVSPGPFTKVVYKITFKAGSGTVWFDVAALNYSH
jgi:hypothetical protein